MLPGIMVESGRLLVQDTAISYWTCLQNFGVKYCSANSETIVLVDLRADT
jgi:hypothetical protein